jgi:A/G-specific adenine glycosylase
MLFVSKLLNWHETQSFSFPWRDTKDPFKILVSELLLRKTTRNQVSRLYEPFFSIYPNVEALLSADRNSLEEMIRPLGMEHIRAVALKDLAEAIISKHHGRVPNRREQLLSLPHVGPYIANAVLCFAFGKDVPLLDTNSIRVVSRVFTFKSVKKRAREDSSLWRKVEEMIPRGKARNFNFAILDFAASICTSKNPKCFICPMLVICDYGKLFTKQPETVTEDKPT